MSMGNKYLEHFIFISHKIYPQKLKEGSLAELEADVIGFCEKNRFAHYFAYAYSHVSSTKILRKLLDEYSEYLKNRAHNLEVLHKVLPSRDFAVIKTFSSYPHMTHDIDIVIRPSNKLEYFHETLQAILGDDNRVDFHTKVSWTRSQEVSDEFFWKHVVSRKIGNIYIIIPDTLLDALIRIAHIPFEQGCIRYGELLHLFRQLKRLDSTLLESEAKRCGWVKTYQRMMELLNTLHEDMFGLSISGDVVSKAQRNIVFPVRVPLALLAGAIIEKRAWGKLWGARYILKDRMGL